MKSDHTLSVLVRNQPGALAKIAGMFHRRGYNIETVAVYKSHIEGMTKILISGQAHDRDAELLRRQVENMVDVREARLLDRGQSFTLEMCLVRMGFDSEAERAEVMAAAAPYKPNLRAENGRSVILEVAGSSETVDEFVRMAGRFKMMDVSRTGMTVLGPHLPTTKQDDEETPDPEP
ncbi:MAG: acetolactate synthase small subunit [Acidobacteria bacterium]|nr:acetolactate synthase small subunit [Acidobacteriota bacterium]